MKDIYLASLKRDVSFFPFWTWKREIKFMSLKCWLRPDLFPGLQHQKKAMQSKLDFSLKKNKCWKFHTMPTKAFSSFFFLPCFLSSSLSLIFLSLFLFFPHFFLFSLWVNENEYFLSLIYREGLHLILKSKPLLITLEFSCHLTSDTTQIITYCPDLGKQVYEE